MIPAYGSSFDERDTGILGAVLADTACLPRDRQRRADVVVIPCDGTMAIGPACDHPCYSR